MACAAGMPVRSFKAGRSFDDLSHESQSNGHILHVTEIGIKRINARYMDGHLVCSITADSLATQCITGVVKVKHKIIARRALLL